MAEPKISLSLLVPGANMLSSQECEKNSKDNYEEFKVTVSTVKGIGKKSKEVKKVYTVHTRKSRLITHHINMTNEAYEWMLDTPTNSKLAKPLKLNNAGDVIKRVWDTLSIHQRLKAHFDLIAHDLKAVTYSYEILKN